jgi:hypothetical protein
MMKVMGSQIYTSYGLGIISFFVCFTLREHLEDDAIILKRYRRNYFIFRALYASRALGG